MLNVKKALGYIDPVIFKGVNDVETLHATSLNGLIF